MDKYSKLEELCPNVQYDVDMKKYNTTKVGGTCKCMVEPESIEQVQSVLKYVREENLNYYVIGNGSNLLVKDEGYDGVIIRITNKLSNLKIEGETITVDAGCSLVKVCQMAKMNSLAGLEFACGIPGTIGGAVRMNAGAYGGEMISAVEKVGYIDENGELKEIDNAQCEFSYRHSMFVEHPEYVIVYAILKLHVGNVDEITEIMDKNMTSRREKQPIEWPNFGSVFKRPTQEGVFVGKMIEELGLKGYKIGGAQVSEKHAGFIINTGDATCKDVLDLIEYIKDKVYNTYDVMLQEEVVILGGN